MAVAAGAQSPVRYAPRWLVPLVFGLLLVLGAGLVPDYGVSWDEPVDRANGLVSLRYVAGLVAPEWAANQLLLQSAPPLAGYVDNDHGVLFEVPLALLDVLRPGTDPRTYYLLRHFGTWLVCLGGLGALYGLARRRFRNQYLALLTAGLFVLSPRMFAESFYNAKDLVFLAAFTLGIYTLSRLLARPTAGRALVHALATAAAIDIRILGLLLVPFTLGLLALEASWPTQPVGRGRLAVLAGGYLLLAAATTVLGWPYLWEAPLTNLLAAFGQMQRFRWDGPVWYLGRAESSLRLPWHYAPVWLLITTPVAYSLAGLAGLLALAGRLLRHPKRLLSTAAGRLDLLFGGWLLGPFVLVIGLQSVIYDGWRHLYFTYPALLLLAVGAGRQLWAWARAQSRWRPVVAALGLLAALEAVVTAGRMVAMHPQQQVYFSFLPAQVVEQQFERDYWGLAYRQGLEWLLRHQPTGRIAVDVSHLPPFENNLALLPAADRARFVFAPEEPGHYYITGFRFRPVHLTPEMGRLLHTVRADGVTVLVVCQTR
ncbi:hypothetical protein [Hymenobacter rubripertinctus]|uniref:Phospholipid carrier-dependent glycosyltransferase n=1 Tax=Hymenobacter rubripertinctus TaxID=2029981 RepID=A0A418R6M1_9BACT|nr:hypothetical protein [Hymenobacter rubripertinctus]RIY13042.1 hypothetical protein D0T11_04765 [Hymenobacter rubripertinctus]